MTTKQQIIEFLRKILGNNSLVIQQGRPNLIVLAKDPERKTSFAGHCWVRPWALKKGLIPLVEIDLDTGEVKRPPEGDPDKADPSVKPPKFTTVTEGYNPKDIKY